MSTLVKKPAITIIVILSIIVLFLLLSVFATPLILHVTGSSKPNVGAFYINRLVIWGVLLLLLAYLKYVANEKLLIWEETKRSLWFYLLAIIIILAVLLVGSVLTNIIVILLTHEQKSQRFLQYIEILKNNMPLLFFTALTAGVVEELIFRGYMQTRLDSIFKSPVWGIVVSSILFAIVHIAYGTVANVVGPLFIGLVFAFFYWQYRNIKILILCHFLWDVLVLLISIKNAQGK